MHIRTILTGLAATAVAELGLAFSAPINGLAADCPVSGTYCDAENSTGGQVTGSGNVQRNEDDCITSWDCYYDDGMTRRYIVPIAG
jgi:hypothetical protein